MKPWFRRPLAGRAMGALLGLLVVLAAGLLLLPFLYHQLQVGSDVQGYLWLFGARPLVLLLLFALVLIVVLAVIRRRR